MSNREIIKMLVGEKEHCKEVIIDLEDVITSLKEEIKCIDAEIACVKAREWRIVSYDMPDKGR